MASVLVAGAGLLGPATSAHAVDGISGVTLAGAKIAIPASGSTTTGINLAFAGPVDATITYSAKATVSTIKSTVTKSKRKLPTVAVPTTLTPNTTNTIQIASSAATSSGDYRVTIVVSQAVSGTVVATAKTTAKVTLYHSADDSRTLSSFKHIYYYSATKSKLKVLAAVPRYMAGAKVKVIYLKTLSSSDKVIGSGKVSSKGGINIKTKKVTMYDSFYLIVQVKSRPYASAYEFGVEVTG